MDIEYPEVADVNIGHNSGIRPLNATQVREYLADAESAVIQRRRDLQAAIYRFKAAHPHIENDEMQARAGDFVKQIKTHIATIEIHRKEAKEPYLEGGRVVDKFFKDEAEPLVVGVVAIQKVMTAYATEQDAKRRKQAEQEAAAARAEAARLAELAAQDLEQTHLEDAIQASQVAADAQRRAEAKPAEFTRARGDYGSTSSLRETIRIELDDITKVPTNYLLLDEKKALAAIKLGINIPGVRKVIEKSVVVR